MVDLFGRVVDSLEFEDQEGVVDQGCHGRREAWRWHPVGFSQAWVLSGWCKQKAGDGQGNLRYKPNVIKIMDHRV